MAGSKPLTFADLEEKYDGFYTPAFRIDVAGETLFSAAKGRASSVSVRTATGKANRVSFTVGGVFDQQRGDFEDLASRGISTGEELSVRVGYGSTLETVLVGTVTDVQPNFPAGGAPTVKVVGHGFRHAMDQSSGDDSWQKTTIPAATEAIANRYNFESVEIGRSGASPEEIRQLVKDAESDLGFLRRLADTHNYEMFTRGGVLVFREPNLGGEDESVTPRVELAYGSGLRSFQRRAGAKQSTVSSVKAKGVDHRTGDTVSGESTREAEGQGSDSTRIVKTTAQSDTEAERRAKATATSIGRDQRSSGETLGLPDLRIGDWVKLTGLGSVGGRTYDGTYYLQSVDHSVDDSGYSTRIQMSDSKPEGSS